MKYNRVQEIRQYVESRHSVSNEELLKEFDISIQTLRRDLKELEEQGHITKVYGGVIYNEPVTKGEVDPIEKREASNADEKDYIGKLAAGFVEDNDVIFVDSGTTACRMLKYLGHVKNVTVISHCLDVMQELKKMRNLTGVCAGGALHPDTGTFLVDTSFYPYNYNKSFISAVGISTVRGMTNTYLQEGFMKHHVIEHSHRVYLVADHTKFDVIAFNHFADFSEIDTLITDREPPKKYEKILESNQVKIVY
ncbi:MAG: DeoR/GlpR transcriptional regulator [Erysipelotrichales bacterium]|nr:DeoR/GlpR transcriptional regulator [Erysipelotrichales bacterium]MBQ2309629.1 DeoR/GlpR transcriptional regulator [Erysipelotrichales bacterium]MBQ2479417.1 DeoR/GlpR transcriptional regulator [Erysipelotrichales bacterium]MBQ4374547.1 DeoR/GlpR transcriptional regulator [Erysipelotrichales bacterium]MBQ5541494.1 DeoR/GlpR transcriptional regulator [Erysipelotrichales bacterium]